MSTVKELSILELVGSIWIMGKLTLLTFIEANTTKILLYKVIINEFVLKKSCLKVFLITWGHCYKEFSVYFSIMY